MTRSEIAAHLRIRLPLVPTAAPFLSSQQNAGQVVEEARVEDPALSRLRLEARLLLLEVVEVLLRLRKPRPLLKLVETGLRLLELIELVEALLLGRPRLWPESRAP